MQAAPERGPAVVEAVRGKGKGLAILAAVVVAIGALIILDSPPPGIEFPSLGNTHLQSVSEPHIAYNSSPPSSGPHFGGLAPWGVSEEAVPPELFVHNLEDGGVVLTYDCAEECPEFVEGLSEFTDGGRVLVTPYSGIVDPEGNAHRGAAVAWTRVFYFDELDEETVSEIETFISLFEGLDHHVTN